MDGNLSERHIKNRRRSDHEPVVVYVRDDTDNFPLRRPEVEIVQPNGLANWIAAGPKPARKGFVDEHHLRGSSAVVRVELPTAHQWYLHRAEISGAYILHLGGKLILEW